MIQAKHLIGLDLRLKIPSIYNMYIFILKSKFLTYA